jgi:two-component system, sensor histidine kinase
MIDNIRNKFLIKNTQTIILDKNGVVIQTDNLLFPIEINSKIHDFHPFFEVGFDEILKKPNNIQTFYCVHIETEKKVGAYDIYFNSGNDKNPAFLLFMDFTERYSFFQTIAQEKNVTVLSFREEALKNEILKIEKAFKDKFLANVSHDLRTPIASMLGFIEIFQQTALSKQQHDFLKTILNTANHLNGLVEDLIDISKIESGHFSFKNKSFDFYDFVNQIEKTYNVKAAIKNIDFLISFDPKIAKFLISDRVRLFQMLGNIIDNAIKFTEKGNISIVFKEYFRRADNLGLQIIVTDTGIGFSNKNKLKVFESFTRLHMSDYGGMGLGLSIVQEIVTKMDGTIKIKSAAKQGTTVELNLPIKIDMEISMRSKRIVVKQFLPTDFKKKYKILVVDDNETNQLLLLKILSDHGGFFIDITDTASQALEVIETEGYDLILTDINMPGIDGLEAIEKIKSNTNPKIAKTPIITLSANPTASEKKRCNEIGIKHYIARPHTREELFLAIYKALKVKKD